MVNNDADVSYNDELFLAVEKAITATQDDDEAALDAALETLEKFPTLKILSDLLIWIIDLTDGIDIDTLLAACRLPLPPKPREIIKASLNKNIPELVIATSPDTPERVIGSLLVLVASLKDARENVLGFKNGD